MAYTRVNWEDLPSTDTPINATNLNKMDKGIKDNYDEIQTKATLEDIQDNLVNVSNEVDEDYRVNLLKGKNLFDKNSGIISGYYYSSTGSLTGDVNYSSQTIFIKVKPNTKYTFSSQNADLMIMCEYDSNKNFIERKYTSPLVSNITYTTGSTTEYIKVSVRNENISSYQLEEGDTATSYEPYITPSIYVDNEEIYSKPTVLWQNSLPTNAFASGSITLNDNLSNYSYYEVLAKTFATENNIITSGRIPTTFSGEISRLVKQLSRYRAFTNNNSSLTFSDAEGINTNATGSTTVNNSWLVPYQVIGYK